MKELFGMLCDHWIETPKQGFKKPINYVMAQNGCFEIRETPLGKMTIRAEKIVGLQSQIEEGLELAIPEIPGSILSTTIDFFRAVYQERNGSEAFLQIFYNQEEQEYFLHCPPQQVSGMMVAFERNPELEASNTLVMDIHSHNSMPAFFSNIDNADEKEDRLYGVVGFLHQRIPQMEFRMGIAGRFVTLSGQDLFGSPEAPTSWPKEWMERCECAPMRQHKEWESDLGRNKHQYFRRRNRKESWGSEWEQIFTDAGQWEEEVVFHEPTKKDWFWS